MGGGLVEVVLGSYIRRVRVERAGMLTVLLVVALSTASVAGVSPTPLERLAVSEMPKVPAAPWARAVWATPVAGGAG